MKNNYKMSYSKGYWEGSPCRHFYLENNSKHPGRCQLCNKCHGSQSSGICPPPAYTVAPSEVPLFVSTDPAYAVCKAGANTWDTEVNTINKAPPLAVLTCITHQGSHISIKTQMLPNAKRQSSESTWSWLHLLAEQLGRLSEKATGGTGVLGWMKEACSSLGKRGTRPRI